MIQIEEIAKQVYDKIANVYQHGFKMFDKNNDPTDVPSKSKTFIFPFVKDDKYSQVMVTLSDGTDNDEEPHNGKLSVVYYENIDKKLDPAQRQEWFNFKSGLKNLAVENIWQYEDQNISKVPFQKNDDETTANITTVDDLENRKQVAESLTGTSRSSYQNVGPVRIIARHTKKIDPEQRGARSRHISNLFIETDEGERFKCPEGTTLNGVRAIARHFKNGGNMQDELGQHITNIIKEMHDLRFFVRNMRGKTFEDNNTDAMVKSAIDHYGDLHRTLFSLRGQRGYQQYKELWHPEQIEEDTINIEELKERFSRKIFDERLTVALPIVDKVFKKTRAKELIEFENWSNDILNEIENPIELANDEHIAKKADIEEDNDQSVIDNDKIDPTIQKILDDNEFRYNIQDGTIWFDSKEEVERAKDFFADSDPNMNMPNMGVRNYNYGLYGDSTAEREIVDKRPMEENKNFGSFKELMHLAGITK